MSSAGRAANSNGCVLKPKEHATGLIGFAAQIRRSSLIGSCAMETAEHREPCESRGSRTDLGAPGGEIPPGDSTKADVQRNESDRMLMRQKYRYGCIAQDIAGSATEDELPQSTLRIGSLDQEVTTQCVRVLQNRLPGEAAVEADS